MAEIEMVVYNGVQFRPSDLPKGVDKKDTMTLQAWNKKNASKGSK